MTMENSVSNLIENYANRESLENLGWAFVPQLDCIGLAPWADITNLAIREGFAVQRTIDWFVQPIALRNAAVSC